MKCSLYQRNIILAFINIHKETNPPKSGRELVKIEKIGNFFENLTLFNIQNPVFSMIFPTAIWNVSLLQRLTKKEAGVMRE